jgi:hypothetical protein
MIAINQNKMGIVMVFEWPERLLTDPLGTCGQLDTRYRCKQKMIFESLASYYLSIYPI